MSFLGTEAYLYQTLQTISRPELITTKSFESFFIPPRADGKYATADLQLSRPDSLIAGQIGRTYGSNDDFIEHIFETMMEADFE